jgi:pectate lyase C
MSDYCVCSDGEAVASAEPEPQPTPEPSSEPAAEPTMTPEPAMEPEAQPEPLPEQPDIGPRACECEDASEEYGTVNSTIVVGSGQTYDGECKIFRANPGSLGDGSQAEGQAAVFQLENGSTLRNVVLGASAADGIHTSGNVTLENIHWLDIGEDALTITQSGTVTLDCGSAQGAEDKVFQVNAASEFHISNFTATNGGKFVRQNGDTTFEIQLFIDHCDISRMDEVIFRTDSGSSHVTMTNTRYSGLGDGLFMFGSRVVNGESNQSTVSNNEQY